MDAKVSLELFEKPPCWSTFHEMAKGEWQGKGCILIPRFHVRKMWGIQTRGQFLASPEKPFVKLFWRADLLSCFQGNKRKNDCEV